GRPRPPRGGPGARAREPRAAPQRAARPRADARRLDLVHRRPPHRPLLRRGLRGQPPAHRPAPRRAPRARLRRPAPAGPGHPPAGGFEDSRSLTDLRRDANNELVSVDERRRAQVLLQRKLAEPFTNLALLLVAVPLALSYSRSRGVAFGVSLVVTLVWYLFYTF